MTDRPRLDAAVDAAMAYKRRCGMLRMEPSAGGLARALAPHVPERDELVEALRGLARQWGAGAALADRLNAGDASVIACGEQLADCADQLRAILARHAPEPTDG